MPTIAVITGTGIGDLPGVRDVRRESVATPYGTVETSRVTLAGVDVLALSRHGAGHRRLSNHVNHRANIWAVREAAPSAVVGFTACGSLDASVPRGGWIVFDDLYFPSNRLPDGQLATLYDEPGEPARGHWIFDSPFSESVRRALVHAAAGAGREARDAGVYGHVDGPRYNTPSEVRALQAAGVTAISQTGGPETVLCGEAELPYALVGYVTDHANGVSREPTPVEEVRRLSAEHGDAATALLTSALPELAATTLAPAGLVYRYERTRRRQGHP